jgi:hypothetical protein
MRFLHANEEKRSDSARARRNGLCSGSDATNGASLHGSSWQPVRRAASAIICPRGALDRVARKKGSLGSGQLSRQPCVRSMRNIWLVCGHRLLLRLRSLHGAGSRNLSGQHGVLIKTRNPIQNIAPTLRVSPGRHEDSSNR